MALTHRYVAVYPTGASDPTSNTPYGSEGSPSSYDAVYTSLASMESGEDGDLTSGDGTKLHVEIIPSDGSWSGASETGPVIFDGWKTDEAVDSSLVEITTYGTARSSTGLWDTSAYILENATPWRGAIDLDNDANASNYLDIEINYVQLKAISNSTGNALQVKAAARHKEVRINGCYFLTSIAKLVRIDPDDATNTKIRIKNCIFDCDGGNGLEGAFIDSASNLCYIYNCTIFGAAVDGIETGGFTTGLRVVNCAIFNNVDDTQDTFPAGYPNYCASDDNDVGSNKVDISPGGTELTDWHNAFTDPDGSPPDVTIKDTDSVLYLAGQNATADSEVPADDIIGTARPTGSNPVSIGAFELVSGVSDISINTNQSINLLESVQGQLSVAGINITEVINLSESIESYLSVSGINVTDDIEIVESINRSLNLGDLSIAELIELNESITSFLNLAGIGVSENLNVEESISAEIESLLADLEINIFQLINLNESTDTFINLGGITADETINITEAISQFLTIAGIDVLEDITINENISPLMNLGTISIEETVSLAEALTSGVPIDFSQFENITLTEFLSLLEFIAPSKFENITITEYLELLKDIGLSQFENITITEQVAAAVTAAGLNVFDSISIQEAITILKDIGLDTSQDITIAEVVNAVMVLAGVEASEDVTINEALSLLMSLAGIDTAQSISISEFVSGLLEVAGVDVSDNLTLTEFVNLLTTSDLSITDAAESITILEAIEILFSYLPLTVEQNITIIESVTAALTTSGIDISDSVNISEYALLILSLGLIDVSDSVTISEAITALLETTGVNVYDTITVNEFIINILEVAGINVNESVTVSEWIYITMVTVAGLMRVNFSVRKPYLNYATRKPKITFN